MNDSLHTTLAVSAACLIMGAACGWWLRGDTLPPVAPLETAPAPTVRNVPTPIGTARESSPDQAPGATPLPFAAALRASLDDRDPLSRGIRLRQIIRELDPADLPAAVGETARLPWRERSDVLAMIGARWGEADAQAGVAFAGNSRDEGIHRTLLRHILSRWTARDPLALAAWMKATPGDYIREEVLPEVVAEIARNDPDTALDFLKTQPRRQRDISGYRELFDIWAGRDPQAAGTAAILLATPEARSAALESLAQSWVRRDAAGARAWAAQIGDAGIRSAALREVVRAWARDEPEAALAFAQAQGVDLLAYSPAGGNILETVVFNFANRDPASASQLLANLPGGEARGGATAVLLRSWIGSDAPAAVAWVQQLPAGNVRNNALRQAMEFWVQRDARAALDWLAHEPSDGRSKPMIAEAMEQWADRAPEDALAWATAQTNEKVRASAVPAIIRSLAEAEPARAADLFAKQFAAAPDAELSVQIAAMWTRKDAPAAAQWAQGLPGGEAKTKAFTALASNWAYTDLTAAGQWLQRLPAGGERDHAISGFAQAVFNRDRDGAFAWLKTIGDPSLREGQFKAIATRWMKDDPEGAKRWIQTTDQLSPAAKKDALDED